MIYNTNTTFINIFIFKILCSIKEEEFGHGASYISPKLRKRNQLSNSDSDDDWDRGIYIYIYMYIVFWINTCVCMCVVKYIYKYLRPHH